MIIWFWTSLIALCTPFVIYPLSLFVLSRFKRPRQPGQYEPKVSLIISAYNEAGVIQAKIENALQLDYPKSLLEILVISDASDDGTDNIVLSFQDQSVRLCRLEERSGKSSGLTKFCPSAECEILIFTDANSMFRSDALKKLIRHFEDPQVGYSVGRQLYTNSEKRTSAASENFYWNIELNLKGWESRLSSVVGADGAIYAPRKELFEPLTAEDINDFYIPLRVVTRGYRGVFDEEAICYEEAAPTFGGEFRRKYRIVNRSMRAVTKVPQALNPFRVGWFAYQLFAHKVLRWLSPFFLLSILVSSAWLSVQQNTFYQIALSLQLAGYAIASLHLVPSFRSAKIIYIAYYFLLVNFAAAIGVSLLLRGRTVGVWKPQR